MSLLEENAGSSRGDYRVITGGGNGVGVAAGEYIVSGAMFRRLEQVLEQSWGFRDWPSKLLGDARAGIRSGEPGLRHS